MITLRFGLSDVVRFEIAISHEQPAEHKAVDIILPIVRNVDAWLGTGRTVNSQLARLNLHWILAIVAKAIPLEPLHPPP